MQNFHEFSFIKIIENFDKMKLRCVICIFQIRLLKINLYLFEYYLLLYNIIN